MVTLSIEQIDDSAEDDEDEVDDPAPVPEVPSRSETNNNLSTEKPRKREKRKHKGSIDKALDDLALGARIFTDSESDTEIYEVKPTRSGRCPKTRKLQAPDINKLDEPHADENPKEEMINPKIENPKLEPPERSDESLIESSHNETPMMEDPVPQTTVKNTIPDMSKVKPGSLVILSSESPGEPGKTMLQVYMVSPSPNSDGVDSGSQKSMTPVVDLSSELLATVTTKISEIEAPNVDGQQSVNTA